MLYITTFLVILFLSKNVFANPMCVVCTFAIASGFSVAKLIGLNDLVIGVWSGSLFLVFTYWTDDLLKKFRFRFRFLLILLSYYMLLIPLYLGETPNVLFHKHTILGLDAFLFSNIIGSLVLLLSLKLYKKIKENNNGKSHFPYEKVFLPVAAIFVTSILFNFIKFGV